MAWDLELVSFASVSSVVLFLFPFLSKDKISSWESVSFSVIPFINSPFMGSSLNSKLSLSLTSKSLIFSLYISKYHNFIL